MRKLWLFALALMVTVGAQAQQKTLTEVLTLTMPEDPGARASSIAWHPTLKKYYAPKSGNARYSMAIFDPKGKLVSPEGLETQFDIRGFWYNPKLKTFCANGYNDLGWATYILDSKGIPNGFANDINYKNQPFEQSVGSYDTKNDVVYFLDGQYADYYKNGKYDEKKSIRLWINCKDYEDAKYEGLLYGGDETPDNINFTSLVYTGIPKAEFALLNVEKKTIDFYDAKTGFITKVSQLPADAPANDMLCFTYTNNIFFLFDLDSKTWHGYK